jgi:hypothetical protein
MDAVEEQPLALVRLPLPLAQRILLALPVDSRARAACVARGWRDALADPALWTRLDLSDVSDVSRALDGDALLRGAAGRAQGQGLYSLDVSGPRYISPAVLLAVVTANAVSLRELRVFHIRASGGGVYGGLDAQQLVRAAPMLQALGPTALQCSGEEALPLMRAEPPWAPLRLSKLSVSFRDVADVEHAHAFAALLADVALQPALLDLTVYRADTSRPDVLDALVDALLTRRVHTFALHRCTPPAPAPLARLLAGGALTNLSVSHCTAAPLFDAAGAALVAGALRATTALTAFSLVWTGLSRDMPAAATLLGALVGHPSLRALTLCERYAAVPGAPLGAALAALVAADAPALHELDLTRTALGDDGLAPLMDALPRNRHLFKLNIDNCRMSDQFARERLLPAVRANNSLRELYYCDSHGFSQDALEAQEVVAQRQRRS